LTPASNLTNTSSNIVAGNNISLDVSGALTNTLPPPALVHEDYGSLVAYNGCMTSGGYKESYCEAYVEQQSGNSSNISAGNGLTINAGSLTNVGSQISAGQSATINVSGPIVNSEQTLNAYWHSEWVQQTSLFSSDKRNNVWACGSVAECTAIYGSAYTSVGGVIDPPTPIGNIAATIEAPNLTITSGGQVQNVGNLLGNTVTLTGTKLINGITGNLYTPSVSTPSQVISLAPATSGGMSLALPNVPNVATSTSSGVSYVVNAAGNTSAALIGPANLLAALPASLQPSSDLFYYNPQEEDLVLQQAALTQTGEASFVNCLSCSASGLSVADQDKALLYQNAITYATANNIQLGTALTQTQIASLTQPILWYVEETVPDPNCTATGGATCPTVTALMPQVYLPPGYNAETAEGNISGSNVTLNFNGSGGSILNTGSISASNTLTVNTPTLTNQQNQTNVGQILSFIQDAGYEDTTGTVVQPGGFMSAANMNLNVQTLNQIGGALQQLNSDGTVNAAGSQQLISSLQAQLGSNFTQSTVANNLNTSFTGEGGVGVVGEVLEAALSIVATYYAGPMGAMVSNEIDQSLDGQGFSGSSVLKAGAVAYATEDLSNYVSWASGSESMSQLGSGIANGTATASQIGAGLENIAGDALASATVNTIAYGGSFGQALENSVVSSIAAAGAGAIGTVFNGSSYLLSTNSPLYVLTHAALGCAASAAEGTGCAGGAIGAAASTITNEVIDPTGNMPSIVETAIATAVGGLAAGIAGANVQGGLTAAENETVNNWLNHIPPSASVVSLSDQQKYDNALADCVPGSGSSSCGTESTLSALSTQNNTNLMSACLNGPSSGCSAQISAANAGGNIVATVPQSNGTYSTTVIYPSAVNTTNAPYVIYPSTISNASSGSDSYQTVYNNSFDGQAAQSTATGLGIAGTGVLVSTTGSAIAAIPGAPIFSAGGLLGTNTLASPIGTGLISLGINGGAQILQTGTINPVDLTVAGLTGAAGALGGLTGASGLLWNVGVNGVGGAGGAAVSNYLNGTSNSIVGAGLTSAAVGGVGYGFGTVIGSAVGTATRPTINSINWSNTGQWASSGWPMLSPNNVATISGAVAGASSQETTNAIYTNLQAILGTKK